MSTSELDALIASLTTHLKAAQDHLRGLTEEVESLRTQRDDLAEQLRCATKTPIPAVEEVEPMELEPLDDGSESTAVLPRWRATGRTEREDQTDRVVLTPH